MPVGPTVAGYHMSGTERLRILNAFDAYVASELSGGREPTVAHFHSLRGAALKFSCRSLLRWIEQRKKHGDHRLHRQGPRGGRVAFFKKNPHLRDTVIDLVRNAPVISAEKVADEIRKHNRGIAPAPTTILRLLKELESHQLVDPLRRAKNRYLR